MNSVAGVFVLNKVVMILESYRLLGAVAQASNVSAIRFSFREPCMNAFDDAMGITGARLRTREAGTYFDKL